MTGKTPNIIAKYFTNESNNMAYINNKSKIIKTITSILKKLSIFIVSPHHTFFNNSTITSDNSIVDLEFLVFNI